LENYFFSSTYKADSAINLLPPDEQYKGNGASTLTDLVRGEVGNARSGKWLGYRKNRMESMFLFTDPVTISSVTLNTLIDIGAYIMPPVSIEVWGGNDAGHLKKLSVITPQQPLKAQPAYSKVLNYPLLPSP
jgi:hypothetical protein